MDRVFLALGGNVGDVRQAFDDALTRLDARPDTTVNQVSPFLETAPVGEGVGRGFLNAAAELATSLGPDDLLAVLHDIEADFGRARSTDWTPRPIDLDLLLYGELVQHAPGAAQVPHPAMWYRRFVLDPLVEIAADVVHPVKGVTITALRERLLARPLTVGLCGGTHPARTELAGRLDGDFADVICQPWTAGEPPTLLVWLGAGDDGLAFDALPRLSRLDASDTSDPLRFLRTALQSALG